MRNSCLFCVSKHISQAIVLTIESVLGYPIHLWLAAGGCVAGGGQPYHYGNYEIVKKRQEALYEEDKNKRLREAHENTEITKLYTEYLGEPYSGKVHELLHTHYEERERI